MDKSKTSSKKLLTQLHGEAFDSRSGSKNLSHHQLVPTPPQSEPLPLYEEAHPLPRAELAHEPPSTKGEEVLPRGSEDVDLTVDLGFDLSVSFELNFDVI